jgi:hypothetical protein
MIRLIWTSDPANTCKQFEGQVIGIIAGGFETFADTLPAQNVLIPALQSIAEPKEEPSGNVD